MNIIVKLYNGMNQNTGNRKPFHTNFYSSSLNLLVKDAVGAEARTCRSAVEALRYRQKEADSIRGEEIYFIFQPPYKPGFDSTSNRN